MHQIPHKSLKKRIPYIRINFDFPGPIEVVLNNLPVKFKGQRLCFLLPKARAVFSCENLTLWKQHAPRSDVTDGSSRRVVNCSRNVYTDKGQPKKKDASDLRFGNVIYLCKLQYWPETRHVTFSDVFVHFDHTLMLRNIYSGKSFGMDHSWSIQHFVLDH